MRPIQSFEDLTVWQRAIELSAEIYELTNTFPKQEMFGLTNQLRRASVSISSNIAEGHNRRTRREFIHFLSVARGSNAEVRSQLALSQRLKLGEQHSHRRCTALVGEVGKMINAPIISLESNRVRVP